MKYYPPSNHIYYENSDVPINKLEIKELEILTEIEKSYWKLELMKNFTMN